MKIAHLADLHCCREHAEEALASLRFFTEYIKTSPVDLVAIAGDVWDASMLNTETSGFNRFTDAIRDIADLAPVAMIYGTPAHDTDGSLEIFRKITCKYGITLLEPGQAYFLSPGSDGVCTESDANRLFDKNNRAAILFGIPEPRKKYLLADTTMGKGETEEAIRAAMHKLCFLLAAKRREYSALPCIVLYHGEVAGSVLQNDQTIERGTGISITVDDLADIGADYYALGHIHKPQKVGNLNAYYAGSIYPKNFGETHKASFKIVDTDLATEGERITSVQTVDFPHPQNIKIESGFPVKVITTEAEGKRVWFEITCTREQRALIKDDTEEILEGLYAAGAAPGSRVTISDIPVETVRAAEITEVNTPEKKFEIWAQNSEVNFDESLVKKIGVLENDITKGAARAAGEWELVSLKLRGAIGIKKGIKQDEIAINFDEYDDGLIALTGANGKGKTTLIENCHPYPQLLTRKGKLQDHFCLRDSFREVIYRNRVSGSELKFLIQVDGQNKSGSCKYFVFKESAGLHGTEWEPLPGVDGNLKPYLDSVTETFGPLELFLRTAFITQRPTKNLPDLTDATAGEKKTLFVELAGIDYLQTFSDAAADKAKQEAAQTHDAEIRAQMLETAVRDKRKVQADLGEAEFQVVNGKKRLEKVTAQGKAAKADVDRLQEAWNAEQLRKQKEDDARAAVEKTKGEIETLKADKGRYEEAARHKAEYEQNIAEYETLQKTVEAETAKKQKVLEANMEKQQAFAKKKAAFDEKIKAVQVERDNLCDKRNGIERLVLNAENNIKLYERDAAEIKENCPTCGQRLPAEKIAELNARREQYLAKIEREKSVIEKQNSALADIGKRIDELNEQDAEFSFDEPVPDKPDEFKDAALRTATAKMQKIDITETRARLAKAQEAAVRIEGLQAQIAALAKLLKEHQAALSALMDGIEEGTDKRLRADLDAALARHTELTEQYSQVKAEIARNEAVIEAGKKTLAEIEAQEKELADARKVIETSKREAVEWELIARAFGKDGIQALELDALAPGISDTANRILESAYGDRFRIEIQTTRIGGAGKKTKQIEDFIIMVIDSEDGEAVALDDKSGGEAVWIKRAIYDAFAVIRKRNTNFAFLTCFQDETDGALDSAAKTAYCRMLEAAHAESKLRHTVIITHSNEVKAMIEQRIEMEGLSSTQEST